MGKRRLEDPPPGKKPIRPREGGGRGRQVFEPGAVGAGGLEDASTVEDLAAGSGALAAPAEPSAPAEPKLFVDPDLPDPLELGAILQEADEVAGQFQLSQQQVAASVVRYDELQTQKGPLEGMAAKRKGWIERIAARIAPETVRLSTFQSWKEDDLKQFVAKRILTPEHAKYLALYNQKIEDLSKQDNFQKSERGRGILATLVKARDSIVTVVQQRLAARQEQISPRIERVRRRAEERYGGRMASIEEEMTAISDSPLVAERLAQREEERKAKVEAARKATELARQQQVQRAREAAEKQKRERLGHLEDALRSMEERFDAALQRVKEIVGSDVDVPTLVKALGEKKKEDKVKPFEPLRNALVAAVNATEKKKKLESPGEVTPWMMKGASSYGPTLQFLNGGEVKLTLSEQEEAKKKALQQRIDRVQLLATMFNYLLNGDVERGDSPFFRAFDSRREAQAARAAGPARAIGEDGKVAPAAPDPDAAKKAAEEKRLLARQIKEVLDAGGFVVEASSPKGLVSGAVLVERTTSKKGTSIYKITRIDGPMPGIKVGDTSATDPSHNSFPPWFRIPVDKHFAEVAKKERVAAVAAAEAAAGAASSGEAGAVEEKPTE